jgi:hypothetical protein
MNLRSWARGARARRRALLVALTAALAAGAQAGASVPGHAVRAGGMPPTGAWPPMLDKAMGGDMPDMEAATRHQRAVARRLMRRTQRLTARYATEARARRAGYRPPRKWAWAPIRHFNSHRAGNDGRVLDPSRPESLLFWRGPDGRGPRRLVAAMFRAPSDRPPPDADNPLLRWHVHFHCVRPIPGRSRQMRTELCPKGLVAHYGSMQMLHVWLTGDLMTAYAMQAPLDALATALGID